MVIADFGIICLGQTECNYPNGTVDICFEVHRRLADSKAMYDNTYNFHTADTLIGNWYFVWPKEEIMYEKPFFDIGPKGRPWVCVAREWRETIRKVLEFYICQSPEQKVAVLIREQDNSDNIVHPILKIDEFMSKLLSGNIRWNELYFIEK
ncbi:MAG: hypothetical protein J1G04_01500 [Clostridiales bacterium]|nr:hypothetical protein [Clostridiales bacterium]